MPKALSLKEALAQRDVPKAEPPVPSGSPIRLRLRKIGEIPRPIDVMRLIAERGCSLRRSHAIFERIAQGETVAVQVWTDEPGLLMSQFAALGVEALELKIPNVSTKDIRVRLNLSQSDFALKFGFELDTVQNWDQGRNQPDPAARVLLAIIDRDPAIVEAVLTQRTAST